MNLDQPNGGKPLDNATLFLVVFATFGLLIAMGFLFIRGSKKKTEKLSTDVNEFETRVLDLIGRFQHISANRLQALENRIADFQKVLKESNEIYLSLSSLVSESNKHITEFEKKMGMIREFSQDSNGKAAPLNHDEGNHAEDIKQNTRDKTTRKKSSVEEEKKEFVLEQSKKGDSGERESSSFPSFDISESSLEHRILNLASEGSEPEEIAKQLKIGKGEVLLVLELFRRKTD